MIWRNFHSLRTNGLVSDMREEGGREGMEEAGEGEGSVY